MIEIGENLSDCIVLSVFFISWVFVWYYYYKYRYSKSDYKCDCGDCPECLALGDYE